MTENNTLVKQTTNKPTRKVAAGGIGGIVLGVPLAGPLADLMVGFLRLFSENTYNVLAGMMDLKSVFSSLVAVAIATAVAYFTRERAST